MAEIRIDELVLASSVADSDYFALSKGINLFKVEANSVSQYMAEKLGSIFALKSEIPSLSGYATQTWVIQQGYAFASQVYTKSEALSLFITLEELSNYYTKPEIDQALTTYYDKVQSDARFALKSDIPSLSGYATITYVNTEINRATTSLESSLQAWVDDNYIGQATLSNYYTKSESDGRFAALNGNESQNFSVFSLYMDAVSTEAKHIYMTNPILRHRITSGKNGSFIIARDGIKNDLIIDKDGNYTLYGNVKIIGILLANSDKTVWDSGNFQPSNYYTKSEALSLFITLEELSNYYTKPEIDQALTTYYDKVQSDARFALKSDIPSLSGYATTTYVNTEINRATTSLESSLQAWVDDNYIGQASLSNYYTKSESDGRFALKTDIPSLANYYTKSESDGRFALKNGSINELFNANTLTAKNISVIGGTGLVTEDALIYFQNNRVRIGYEGTGTILAFTTSDASKPIVFRQSFTAGSNVVATMNSSGLSVVNSVTVGGGLSATGYSYFYSPQQLSSSYDDKQYFRRDNWAAGNRFKVQTTGVDTAETLSYLWDLNGTTQYLLRFYRNKVESTVNFYGLGLGAFTGNLTANNGKQVWDASNSNLSTIDWNARNLILAGSASITSIITVHDATYPQINFKNDTSGKNRLLFNGGDSNDLMWRYDGTNDAKLYGAHNANKYDVAWTASSLDLPLANNWTYIKNTGNNGGLRFATNNSSGSLVNALDISGGGNYVKSYLPFIGNSTGAFTGNLTANNGKQVWDAGNFTPSNYYTKSEALSLFISLEQLSNYYTKPEVDQALTAYYDKAQSDARFAALNGNSAINFKANNLNASYIEADGDIQALGSLMSESDIWEFGVRIKDKYVQLTNLTANYYNKTDSDARFLHSNSLVNYYNKYECDEKFASKSDLGNILTVQKVVAYQSDLSAGGNINFTGTTGADFYDWNANGSSNVTLYLPTLGASDAGRMVWLHNRKGSPRTIILGTTYYANAGQAVTNAQLKGGNVACFVWLGSYWQQVFWSNA